MTSRDNILAVWWAGEPSAKYWCYGWNLRHCQRTVRIECTDGFDAEADARKAAHGLADALGCDLWDSEGDAFAAVAAVAKQYGCYGPVTVVPKEIARLEAIIEMARNLDPPLIEGVIEHVDKEES